MKQALARLQATRALRAWNRYGVRRGNVLASGIAYVAFFSLFPALAIGFTVLGLVVGGRRDLQRQVADYVNDTIGTTVIGVRDGEGVVSIDRLVAGDLLTVTGAVAAVVMLLSGLGWVDAVRQGIRAMFDLHDEGNPLLRKLFDIVVLAVVGIGVLLSVAASLLLSAAGGAALGWLGVDDGVASLLLQIAVDLVLVGVDILLFLMFFRLLARVHRPVRELLGAAFIGAVGLLALKLGAGLLLRMASGNRFLASASILIGLLIWLNMIGRLTLLAAAWAATPPAPDGAGTPLHPLAAARPISGVRPGVQGSGAAAQPRSPRQP
ncbi:MAG: YihY/virulence factor BrkB family protein [Kineosporiaceae bacterium]|nr:YihY/virulence factor BrkB family protein [Kineosporiaceae bacterium]